MRRTITKPLLITQPFPRDFGTNYILCQVKTHRALIVCKLNRNRLIFLTLAHRKGLFEQFRRPAGRRRRFYFRKLPICGIDYQPEPIIPAQLRLRALAERPARPKPVAPVSPDFSTTSVENSAKNTQKRS